VANEFPKYLFHPEQGMRLVNNWEEQNALEGEWFESPANFPESTPVLESPSLSEPEPLGLTEVMEGKSPKEVKVGKSSKKR